MSQLPPIKLEMEALVAPEAPAENLPAAATPVRKKKKVDMACVYCRRSHMICDDSRPCKRCIKREIGHLCHDEPVPSRGKKRLAAIAPASHHAVPMGVSESAPQPEVHPYLPPQQQQQQQPQQPLLFGHFPSNLVLSQTMGHHEPFFFLEHAGSEFLSLNDFLSMIDDPELNGAFMTSAGVSQLDSFGQPVRDGLGLAQHLLGSLQTLFQTSGPLPGATGTADEAPVVSDNAKAKFFLTAADPTTEISPEERLKQVIHAKLEAGLLQPYNYAKGYARLQAYMDNYMNASSKQRILKPILIFRPAFQAIARTLKDVDLVLVEEVFERMLLDYDRVFTSMAIPACLWRRTGEIFRGNKEFALLVEVGVDDLKDGKLAIYELMSEELAVNFWEKYGAIAFDKGQKAVLTSCNLRTRDGRRRRACCFSFTIRRDRYNIPSCIVGNFVPIDE